MARYRKFVIWFAGWLALNAGLCLSVGALSGNPYEPIITRNIFDLNPPQAVTSAPVEPPSKITLNGIMNIFGTRQALFYVEVPPRPPAPATQKSYVLSEGQQQDDIEVTRIDEKKGVVTFNNHGVEQEIPLVKAAPITTPTPVVMNTFAPPVGAPNGYANNGGMNSARFGNRFGQNGGMNDGRSFGNNNGNSGNNGGNFGNNNGSFGNSGGNFANSGFGSAGGSSTGGPAQRPLSQEEQTLLIIAQKSQAKQAGDPIWQIFPPTEADQEAGTVNSTP